MPKLGAVVLTTLMLATTPVVAAPVTSAEVPHRIARDVAWGCRDKNDLIDLLFLGLSTSFDSRKRLPRGGAPISHPAKT
jgi:hypothetical protein